MIRDERALYAAARGAYERGRLRAALQSAAPVAPMTALSFVGCHAPALSAAVGLALAVTVVSLRWRGGPLGRGVRAGVVAGGIPLVTPLIMRSIHVCVGPLCWLSVGTCAVAGLVAGAAVGFGTPIHDRRGGNGASASSVLGAALVAFLAGALGCVVAGVAGLAGLGVGLCVGAIPTAIAMRAARSL